MGGVPLLYVTFSVHECAFKTLSEGGKSVSTELVQEEEYVESKEEEEEEEEKE